jgi:hypothetical protein
LNNPQGIVVASPVNHMVIQGNEIFSSVTEFLIDISASTGSQNIIAGNSITSTSDGIDIEYEGSGVTSDVVRDNVMVADTGFDVTGIRVGAGINGLTIEGNTITDPPRLNGEASTGVAAAAGVLNLTIMDNTFDFGDQAHNTAIVIGGGAEGVNTSASIIGNTITVKGVGILLAPLATGAFDIRIQTNDFLAATPGVEVRIIDGGASLAGIDLGGGAQGSVGANNFRFDNVAATSTNNLAGSNSVGAIVIGGGTGAVSAQNNIFGSIGPAASVWDNSDDPSLPQVVTTGNPTGNAAFVQALFVRFLHRAANLTNQADGGFFVTQLNNGVSAASVVNAIVRSAEAFDFVVDDLYEMILNRDADAAGETNFVNQLTSGATLESVEAFFYASPEYLNRFSGDRAFVVSLYATVLNRTAADSEYQSWINQIPTIGRAGVASAILNSSEARGNAAASLYPSLLKRTASTAEIASWANSGLDELSIQTDIAASSEGQADL